VRPGSMENRTCTFQFYRGSDTYAEGASTSVEELLGRLKIQPWSIVCEKRARLGDCEEGDNSLGETAQAIIQLKVINLIGFCVVDTFECRRFVRGPEMRLANSYIVVEASKRSSLDQVECL